MVTRPKLDPEAAEPGELHDERQLGAAACEFARATLSGVARVDGQDAFAHAQGVVSILDAAGAPAALTAAAWLVGVPDARAPSLAPSGVGAAAGRAARAEAEALASIGARFGSTVVSLVEGARRLEALEATARLASDDAASPRGAAARTERLRRMLLAFSRDLRGVLLHLATRLQTLRWHAQRGLTYPRALAQESMDLLAPLANRLGVWNLKWEIEDLAFRTLEPQAYAEAARLLDASREVRLREVEGFRLHVVDLLASAGIDADVQGRAKHLYSLWRKMQGKQLAFEAVHDLRALRVVVASVADCYAALSRLQARWRVAPGEFDDYIARPKANGYRSLHTVVLDEDGRPFELQIRTHEMHEYAEHGVAAHWAYKESGARGYAGAAVAADDARRVSSTRRTLLDQLLAWERESDGEVITEATTRSAQDRVYVFTPQGAVVDLPMGSTAIDFAYALHTTLGHRCRGAKLDGVLVPLDTPLASGQTIEISAAKDGGPSLDWLNPELGYLASPRSKAKVRAWFNAQAHEATVAQGRERLERHLQRLSRTAAKHADIATRLGLADTQALYAALGKDELPLRDIDHLWETQADAREPDDELAQRLVREPSNHRPTSRGDVLVVGVDSLLTGLARCCRPAPPDAIAGFVTRAKGVAIHREACTNFRHMARRSPQRVIEVQWGAGSAADSRFAVDITVEANDRPGLLRDVTEVLAKERLNVVGASTQSVRDARGVVARMLFTVEVARTDVLGSVLAHVAKVPGVRSAQRK